MQNTDYFIPLTLAKLENQRLMEQLKLERAQNEILRDRVEFLEKWNKARDKQLKELQYQNRKAEINRELSCEITVVEVGRNEYVPGVKVSDLKLFEEGKG